MRIIKNFMENQKGKRPTASQIKSHLMKSENMDSISWISIKKILKNKLNYRYKRISTFEYNSVRPFNIRKYFLIRHPPRKTRRKLWIKYFSMNFLEVQSIINPTAGRRLDKKDIFANSLW